MAKVKRKPVPTPIKQKLMAHTGNQCAMPDCTNLLYENDVYRGQIAHIYPVGGPPAPRHDPSITQAFIDSYDNMLVVCGLCHPEVDHVPLLYTAEDLFTIKHNHEARFKDAPVTPAIEALTVAVIQQLQQQLEVMHAENTLLREQTTTLTNELRRLNERTLTAPPGDTGTAIQHAMLQHAKTLKHQGLHKAALSILRRDTDTQPPLSPADRHRWQVELALTLMDMNDAAGAAPILVALADEPTLPKSAKSLIAIGYFLQEDYLASVHWAKASIHDEPDEVNGYVCYEQLRAKLSPSLVPPVEWPAAVASNAVLLAALARLREEEGDYTAACALYSRIDFSGIEQPVLRHDLMSYYGIALLSSIRYPEKILKGARPPELISIIDQAQNYLTAARDYFSTTELVGERVYLYIDLGIIYQLTGDEAQARYHFSRAFELKPSFTTLKYSLAHAPDKDWDSLLNTGYLLLMDPKERIDLTVMDAERLAMTDNIDPALAKLEAIYDEVLSCPGDHTFYFILLGELFLRMSRETELDQLLTLLGKKNYSPFARSVLHAKKNLVEKDQPHYHAHKDMVFTAASELDAGWARGIAYQVFTAAGDHGLAADVLAPLCDQASVTSYTRDFVESLYKAGRYRVCAEWATALLARFPGEGVFVDTLATIYEYTGNREKAIALIEAYLGQHSSMLLKAKLGMLFSMTHAYERARAMLGDVKDFTALNASTRMHLATALAASGQEPRALELAYETYHLYPDEPSLAPVYLDLLLAYCWNHPLLQTPGCMTVNCTIRLRSDDDAITVTLVPEPRFDTERSLDDPIAAILLGRTLGEEVTIEGGHWLIESIQTKYSHLQTVCQKIHDATQTGRSDFEAEKEAGEHDGVPEHNLLFEVLANRYGWNPIMLWLNQIEKGAFQPQATTVAERETKITPSFPLLFDGSAIVMLALSGQLDGYLGSLPGPIYVSRRLLRYLDEILSQSRADPSRQRSFFTLPPADITADMQRLKETILQKCMIADIPIPADKHLEDRRRKKMGIGNADLITLCHEGAYTVVTEDAVFREQLHNEFQQPALSLLMLSHALTQQGLLTGRTMGAVGAYLINKGYGGVFVSNPVIRAAVKAPGTIAEPTRKAIVSFFAYLGASVGVAATAELLRDLFEDSELTEAEIIKAALRVIVLYQLASNERDDRVRLENMIGLLLPIPQRLQTYLQSHIQPQPDLDILD
ncbi:hypothetical protein Q4E93_13310 [Flavitalea sp. BT771]|uniref:hypothetical protein n=1 Tax=Flavitalea sp. BT771 TaxID=3063329 RepID=UPI0026E4258E|nr:hypothetical protein [Flavitalea sp. BT771]MDO6431577.1 hypothetical protein [Flavitalea sp. BT771]MDV6220485.1 hypothetical protein [Flavitalea sp. BT771]